MPEFVENLLKFEPSTWTIVAVCAVIWNVCTLTVTLLDKRAAQLRQRRVPERRFVFFAAFAGGAGVLAGFYLGHHKTRKGYLLISVWVFTLIWVGIAAALALTAAI